MLLKILVDINIIRQKRHTFPEDGNRLRNPRKITQNTPRSLGNNEGNSSATKGVFRRRVDDEDERGRGRLKEAGTEDRSDFRFWVGEKMFLARLAIEACHLTQLGRRARHEPHALVAR